MCRESDWERRLRKNTFGNGRDGCANWYNGAANATFTAEGYFRRILKPFKDDRETSRLGLIVLYWPDIERAQHPERDLYSGRGMFLYISANK